MNKLQFYLKKMNIALLLLLTSNFNNVSAADNNGVLALNISGTMLPAICKINSDTRQTVAFGDAVSVYKINGKNYSEKIPFQVSCTNIGDAAELTLTLDGTPTTFDTSAVATNIKGLGVEIKVNDQPQVLNKSLSIDIHKLPVLTGVLVKDPSVELNAAPFTATVKIRVDVA